VPVCAPLTTPAKSLLATRLFSLASLTRLVTTTAYWCPSAKTTPRAGLAASVVGSDVGSRGENVTFVLPASATPPAGGSM
jgi:hypothetical protein